MTSSATADTQHVGELAVEVPDRALEQPELEGIARVRSQRPLDGCLDGAVLASTLGCEGLFLGKCRFGVVGAVEMVAEGVGHAHRRVDRPRLENDKAHPS